MVIFIQKLAFFFWCLAIIALLLSAHLFVQTFYSLGFLFFFIAFFLTPPFFTFLRKKNIHPSVPLISVLFLFILFTSPSYFPNASITSAVVLEQNKEQTELEYPESSSATYVIKEYPGSTVIHRSSPLQETEKKVYVPKKEIQVKITDKAFIPQNITISRGTMVIWTNTDPRLQIIHIVNTTGGYTSIARSGRLEFGDSFNMRFDVPGEYPYRGLLLKAPEGHISVTP